jgi:hypothetical protein
MTLGLQWSSFFILTDLFRESRNKKKRERKARPVVFTKGHAPIKMLLLIEFTF